MNDKAKKVLSYVACAIGGACLGIALLGGLSYCSTSSAREKADTINTIDRVRHNEQITTANGHYTGYTFSVYSEFDNTTIDPGNMIMRKYRVDKETYTLSSPIWDQFTITDVADMKTAIEGYYQTYTALNELSFMAFYGVMPQDYGPANKISYFTFVIPNGNQGFYVRPLPFVLINPSSTGGTATLETGGWGLGGNYQTRTYYTIPNGMNPYYIEDTQDGPVSPTFQDVVSYYLAMGYSDGYSAGQTAGNSQGYSSGYEDGYASGFTDGADNSLLFTKIGANQTAWSRSDITWDVQGDTYAMMKCLDFKDGDNNTYYVELNDYTSGGGEVQVDVYKNGTSSNNFYATIGRGNYNTAYTEIDIIPSSYLEFDFAQVITYYHNAIPNNWFMLSGTPANANGYEQGYQKGYKDGQLATPTGQATNNVFSLFTQAFNAVGGIFEMKIFGFLPLYWFFLTPIFIAIITLLLRMVKH